MKKFSAIFFGFFLFVSVNGVASGIDNDVLKEKIFQLIRDYDQVIDSYVNVEDLVDEIIEKLSDFDTNECSVNGFINGNVDWTITYSQADNRITGFGFLMDGSGQFKLWVGGLFFVFPKASTGNHTMMSNE